MFKHFEARTACSMSALPNKIADRQHRQRFRGVVARHYVSVVMVVTVVVMSRLGTPPPPATDSVGCSLLFDPLRVAQHWPFLMFPHPPHAHMCARRNHTQIGRNAPNTKFAAYEDSSERVAAMIAGELAAGGV